MLFTALQSVVSALQGGEDPRFAAAGFALGAALGLLPPGNLIAVAVLVSLFFFRADKGLAGLGLVAFKAAGYAADPAAHRVGRAVLLLPPLKPLWTWLYNLPVVPWSRFNNTVVMGNLVFGVLLFFPVYFASKGVVLAYRRAWKEKVDRWPVVRAVNAWGWVQTAHRWRERLRR